ncbi:MAG TPA: hypothetical protein VEK07_24600 [Polyangiaceae bacterium]|nr:hypothetical protein [Polyangiaceae bacterium]
MCCSLRPAKLTNTILYAAETMHQGRLVHVMGYQNRAAFDKGSYSVALAESANDLVAALDYLTPGRRPMANGEIFAAYDRFYPGWKMALCSWEGTIDAFHSPPATVDAGDNTSIGGGRDLR